MQRSACQSACLALLAVILSAGSAANASMLTTLPSGQDNTQDCIQTIDESGHGKAHVKSRVSDVTETRTERASQANQSDQIITATIDFDAIEHVISLAHASVDIHSLDQPFPQQRETLANLPPPVR